MSEDNGLDSVVASSVIGAGVSLKLQDGEVKGQVYAHDSISGCCVLSNDLGSEKHDVRFIPVGLKNLEGNLNVVSTETQEPLESLPVVNVHALEEREKKALADAQAAIACIGKNVSGEAQEIFDALRKTYPCGWQETTIVVLGEAGAKVRFPYKKESCEGEPKLVERIEMVLDRYWLEKKGGAVQ
jgi:hypothetical protein